MWKKRLEWREKDLAQSADHEIRMNFDFVSTNLAVIGVLSKINQYYYEHDELKRRKRHHYVDSLTYIDELIQKCPKKKEKDSCDYYLLNGSPSILAVPVYGFCKLFG